MDTPGTGKSSQRDRALPSRTSTGRGASGAADTPRHHDDVDDTAGVIADGFRPSTSTPVSCTPSPPRNNPQLSIAKPPRAHDSFALRHDGTGPADAQKTTVTQASSLSADPTTAFINAETPYEGPSGPSYPYQMYPQDVRLARTTSVATSSTENASETPRTESREPTHPYRLYAQGTAANSGGGATEPAISVGFRRAPDPYQRRRGPDGDEVADLIGPDGHTEPLPPYTRYPDDVFLRKVRDAELQNTVASAAAAPATVAPATAATAIPTGAGGLGLATRNLEFDAPEEMRLLHSRHSTRSLSSGPSQHNVNMAASAMAEKRGTWKSWQSRMKRKMCGFMPYWALCLTGAMALLIAVVLGSVMGALMARHKKSPPFLQDGDSPPQGLPTVTVTFDATPISAPTNLPKLATGTWGMPLTNSRMSDTCFSQSTQSRAWDCNLVPSAMQITVDRVPDGDGAHGPYSVAVTCNESLTLTSFVYSYGAQPPIFNQSEPMQLVTDTREPSRGPAWFWMMPLTKKVIVPESYFSSIGHSSSDTVRRAALPAFDLTGSLSRTGVAQTGDRPWICTWPKTVLELFIYAQQNSSWYTPPPVSSATPSVTTTSTTPAGAFLDRTRHDVYEAAMSNHASPATPTIPMSLSSASAPFGPTDTGNTAPLWPPGYPRVLKVEERHVGNSPSPVCAQFEIGDPGTPAKPVRDANGYPVTITIAETEPPLVAAPPARRPRNPTSWHDAVRPALPDRDTETDVSPCSCMWLLT